MSLIKPIDIPYIGDERGSLIAMEVGADVPFEINRVYIISRTRPDVTRGLHAHKNLKQVLCCLAGGCDIYLDDGERQEKVRLSEGLSGLLLDSLVWREISNFTNDCILMVLASEKYDEDDYIRDYQNFLSEVKRKRDEIL